MKKKICKVAILGSGIMGSGIAAQVANAGINSLLLDIVPNALTEAESAKGLTLEHPAVRNRIAAENYQRFIVKARPAAVMDKSYLSRISVGNMEDDLEQLRGCDWIVEVVPEKLEIKQAVLKKIAPYVTPGTILTTNTSGLSVNAIAKDLPAELRQYWMGTHFFNPVRYMKLVELIPCRDTLPEVVEFMREFGEKVLGKGAVICKDTPNFIANRIGASMGADLVNLMVKYDLTISEADAISGKALGRAGSATFGTYDMVGLDTSVLSATVVHDNVTDPAEKARFTFPPFVHQMLEKKLLGKKTKAGFYTGRGKDKKMMDWKTGEYVPLKPAAFPSLDAANAARKLPDKLEAFFSGDDTAAKLIWEYMKRYLLYTASLIPEISDTLYAPDRALRWGYNHSAGPFETWNGLDLGKYVARMEAEGDQIPAWLKEMLELGCTSFYSAAGDGTPLCYSPKDKKYMPIPADPRQLAFPALRREQKVVAAYDGGTLYDLGDGVLGFEMGGRNSAITVPLLEAMSRAQDELAANWDGMVLTGSGKNFCVGADLKTVLPMIEAGQYAELEQLLRTSDRIYLRNKYSNKPVVAAPYGQVLGGGCEITMQCSAVQAAGESYIGLVEVGVGLIPGGGGVKELTMRAIERTKGTGAFLVDFLIPYLENIAMAKVATSGPEARSMGFLRAGDGVSLSQDWLLTDAKTRVLSMAAEGYTAPISAPFAAPGLNDNAILLIAAKQMQDAGFISEYDALIFRKLVNIMTGGGVSKGTMITEQYLLDLEIEAFMELCREQKTKDRIRAMVTTGKPLRN